MLKSLACCLSLLIGLVFASASAEAGGWYFSSYRNIYRPHVTYSRARTVINPPGPSLYVSRSRYVGRSIYPAAPVLYGGPYYSTGPVYPASVGYSFTPYYYPVFSAPVAPMPTTVYEYGW